MITENQGLIMLAGANPVPDPDTIDVALDAHAYLATLEQRSSELVQLETRQIKQEDPKRGRLVLVMAAFAAIILIGVVAFLAGGEEPAPPITDPTTTTSAASTTVPETVATTAPETVATTAPVVLPPNVEEGLAVAMSFTEAMAAGDLETAQSHVLESVRIGLFVVTSTEIYPGEVEWREALGWTTTFEECVVTRPDPVITGISCTVSHSTDISRALGVGPYVDAFQYTVKYEGGQHFGQTLDATTIVDSVTANLDGDAALLTEVFDPFMAWVQANHLNDLEAVMWRGFDVGVPDPWLTGQYMPSYTPESTALWQQYSTEYIAQLDG